MAVGNAFNVGRSGLLTFQRVLTTISHNISNVNTDGYSRQRTELTERYPTPSTVGFIGNGVQTTTTRRIWDEHATNQVRNRETTTNFYSGYKEFASQVDNILADPDAGFAPAMEAFFVAMQGLADDPTSIPAREVVLTEGNAMVDRMRTMEAWISDLRSATNDRIVNKTVEINTYAKTIADMNKELIVARGLGGENQPPNDLLDQRDHVVDELSKVIGVTVLEQDDGSYNIYIGNGLPLVLGMEATTLEGRNDPNDPLNFEVSYIDKQANNQRVPVTSMLVGGGGDLGGVLSFRDEILNPTFNSLGRLAVGMTMTMNAQHREGMDMNGNLGGAFFVDYGDITALPDYKNTVPYTGTVSTTFVDPTKLTTDEYRLIKDPAVGSYTLRNLTKNTAQTLTSVAGPPPYDFTLTPDVDGLQIHINDPGPLEPNPGDAFYIRPMRGASRLFDMSVDKPDEIAAARPIRTEPSITNVGTGTITEATVTNIADPNLLNSIRIEFQNSAGSPPVPANEYRIVPTAPPGAPGAWTAYTGNNTINVNGYDITIAGDVWHGDFFTVGPNTNGVSDNSNALALASLQTTETMENGNSTYHDVYSELVVNVGNNTHRADISLTAQEALLVQAKDLKESISGVNLDEEAANMLQFQQAYAAAAKMLAAADSIFQTLLQAIR